MNRFLSAAAHLALKPADKAAKIAQPSAVFWPSLPEGEGLERSPRFHPPHLYQNVPPSPPHESARSGHWQPRLPKQLELHATNAHPSNPHPLRSPQESAPPTPRYKCLFRNLIPESRVRPNCLLDLSFLQASAPKHGPSFSFVQNVLVSFEP